MKSLKRNQLLFGTLFVIMISCDQGGPVSKGPAIDTLNLERHIKVLASDDFLGRKPFTEGESKTIEYIKSTFSSYELESGNGKSYFQEVPLVDLDAKPSEELLFTGNGTEVSLQLSKDFVAFSERVDEQNTLEESEVVFAGFGIVAPEYDWNDYEGLDVKGKTVIVLVNDPGFGAEDSTLFKGQTMTYYGRWTYKYEEAARQGAAAILIIHDTAPAGYGWSVVRNSWSGSSLYLDQVGDAYKPLIEGWITRDAAIQLFEASKVDMKNFVEKSRSAEFKPIPLGLTMSGSVKNEIKKNTSQNVIAKITGTEFPDQYIIYSAHWDHLGVGTVVDGDSIYNGAHDNATGVAALLELSRMFSEGPKPKRSIIFLAVTAEEQGLLGSKFYVENPIFPVEKTVANINMDGMPYYGEMKDFTVIGYGQSELDELAEGIAEKQGRYIMPDPDPGKGYFFRSDHFHFARVGIPAIFANGTYESKDENKGVKYIEERTMDYLTNKYHRPADEYVADEWSFAGMLQDAELYYKLGDTLANSQLWPSWKDGSEFKSIREGN